MKNSPLKSRGFTLTELAIVLGIVGIVIGAIWVATSSVYANMKVEKAQQEVIAIEHNVRALYAGRSTFAAAAPYTDLTVPLAQAGVFPSEMLPVPVASMQQTSPATTYPRSPWGSVVMISTYNVVAPGDAFEIYLDRDDKMTPSVCMPILAKFIGPGVDSSIIGVYKGNRTWGGPGSPLPDPGISTYTPATFKDCTSAGIMFRLKG